MDFGVGRNGFLHISDVEPQYYRQGGYDPDVPVEEQNKELAAQRRPHRGRGKKRHWNGGRPRVKPDSGDLQKGDEVVVQVIKEGIGTKGPTLSTYLSIPGRYLVLMPSLGRIGVSRKIEDDKARRVLRDILVEIDPPEGLGFIVRTAGMGRTKKELSRDMAYLIRLWKAIVRRLKKTKAPTDIYEENDIIIRTIRDTVGGDVDAIYIDEEDGSEQAKDFLEMVMPKFADRLQYYDKTRQFFTSINWKMKSQGFISVKCP